MTSDETRRFVILVSADGMACAVESSVQLLGHWLPVFSTNTAAAASRLIAWHCYPAPSGDAYRLNEHFAPCVPFAADAPWLARLVGSMRAMYSGAADVVAPAGPPTLAEALAEGLVVLDRDDVRYAGVRLAVDPCDAAETARALRAGLARTIEYAVAQTLLEDAKGRLATAQGDYEAALRRSRQ